VVQSLSDNARWMFGGAVAIWLCVWAARASDDPSNALIGDIESRRERYRATALEIWKHAEVGFQEHRSSALLQALIKDAGFDVKGGVAGMPTAFIGTHGSGSPVIAIIGEFDALPGLSQAATPARQPIVEGAPGHGCGHHLFGTASAAAAIAVKNWMSASGVRGTLRFYGTPAEEGGSGKVYMVRDGLFSDVDVALTWHPDDHNSAAPTSSLANMSAKFRFTGVPAHAAAAPEKGRSALDAVEAMNYMVNMMREHVPQEARIHYIITKGGDAPNVVPAAAEVYYYARHPDASQVKAIFERIVNAARGAALGTDTKMDYEIIAGVHSVLPNETLARVQDRNLRRVGGVTYDTGEQAFAEALRPLLPAGGLPLGSQKEIQRFVTGEIEASSTDVGDVSWVVPTVRLTVATWVPGTPAHSWQAVACGGTSIGTKGMMVAAKTLALTAADLLRDPALVQKARVEFEKARDGFKYSPLLGDRKPALDYRKKVD
jgi:aminobenzoyl-glutamate utilization protein B